MFRRIALTVLLLLTCAGVSHAGEFLRGDNGFYFRPGSTVAYEDFGYWYKDWTWVTPTYSCGYCTRAGYWAYTWKWYADYRVAALAPGRAGTKELILKMAADRDQTILGYQTDIGLIDKLGLNVQVENYGNGIFPAYGKVYHARANVPYQQQVDVDVYGTTDVNAAIQAGYRLLDRVADVMEVGIKGQAGVVALTVAGQERVGVAQSQERAAVGIAQALAPKSVHVETKVTGPARLQLEQPLRAAVRIAAAASCTACHGAGKANVEDFAIDIYDPLTANDATLAKVRRYIGPAADLNKKHCPPGKMLSVEARNELIFGPEPKGEK